jgi:hypothetical protein
MASASRPLDPMAELQNAFSLLVKNWVLAIPTAVVSLLGAVFALFVLGALIASAVGAGMMGGLQPSTGEAPKAGIAALLAAGGLTTIVGFIVLALLYLLAQAVVMGGAERVWHGEPADLGNGLSKAASKLPPLFLLFIIAIVVFAICAIIVVIGWVAAVVLYFLFMYTVPAIVIGNESTMQALGTSYRLVTKNFGPSIVAFLGVFVVGLIGGLINALFARIHVLGLIVSLVVGGFTAAYAALVLVRFYDMLRGSTPQVVTGGSTS